VYVVRQNSRRGPHPHFTSDTASFSDLSATERPDFANEVTFLHFRCKSQANTLKARKGQALKVHFFFLGCFGVVHSQEQRFVMICRSFQGMMVSSMNLCQRLIDGFDRGESTKADAKAFDISPAWFVGSNSIAVKADIVPQSGRGNIRAEPNV
jgi:hypothetical protein